jgi:hypothetical protein
MPPRRLVGDPAHYSLDAAGGQYRHGVAHDQVGGADRARFDLGDGRLGRPGTEQVEGEPVVTEPILLTKSGAPGWAPALRRSSADNRPIRWPSVSDATGVVWRSFG